MTPEELERANRLHDRICRFERLLDRWPERIASGEEWFFQDYSYILTMFDHISSRHLEAAFNEIKGHVKACLKRDRAELEKI